MVKKILHINDMKVSICSYQSEDFQQIQELNKQEEWLNLANNDKLTRNAWDGSTIKYVVKENNKLVGYIRGLTDGHVTLYVCELLIKKSFRGYGLGTELLNYVHALYPSSRIEMLASSSSQNYYKKLGYRSFYGFRKTISE